MTARIIASPAEPSGSTLDLDGGWGDVNPYESSLSTADSWAATRINPTLGIEAYGRYKAWSSKGTLRFDRRIDRHLVNQLRLKRFSDVAFVCCVSRPMELSMSNGQSFYTVS